MEGRDNEERGRRRAIAVALPDRFAAPTGAVARVVPSGRSLLVGIALVVAAAGAFLIARETSLFALQTVDVRGTQGPVAVQARSALAPLDGSSLVTLDGDDVVRRLEALPTIVSAAYDRDFPHSLVVTVVPEQPVGVVRQGADAWLVSARGRVMARLEPGLEPRLPRLWVDRTVSIALGDLLDGDPALLSGPLEVLARSPLAGRVLTARLEEGRLVLVLRSGLELQLGKPAAVALKLAVASRVLADTGSSGGRGSYLDVSVPDRPVGRFNSQPAE